MPETVTDQRGWALELYFTPSIETPVLELWARLEAQNLATPARSGFLPHLSLGLYGHVDEALAKAALERLGTEVRGLDLQLDAFCVFGDAVLSWAPVVTPALLAIHADVHRDGLGALYAPDPLYAPERWVPHVTLTDRLSVEELCLAFQLVLPATRPIAGRVNRVGLCQFRPRDAGGRVAMRHQHPLMP